MHRSSYVQGVPFPSSRLQQQQEKEAVAAHAAAVRAQQQAISFKVFPYCYFCFLQLIPLLLAAQQSQQQQLQQPSHQQPQFYGHGFGARVALEQIPQHLRGKPAFFDASRGIYFDGRQAFFYHSADNDAVTAIELSHG